MRKKKEKKKKYDIIGVSGLLSCYTRDETPIVFVHTLITEWEPERVRGEGDGGRNILYFVISGWFIPPYMHLYGERTDIKQGKSTTKQQTNRDAAKFVVQTTAVVVHVTDLLVQCTSLTRGRFFDTLWLATH